MLYGICEKSDHIVFIECTVIVPFVGTMQTAPASHTQKNLGI